MGDSQGYSYAPDIRSRKRRRRVCQRRKELAGLLSHIIIPCTAATKLSTPSPTVFAYPQREFLHCSMLCSAGRFKCAKSFPSSLSFFKTSTRLRSNSSVTSATNIVTEWRQNSIPRSEFITFCTVLHLLIPSMDICNLVTNAALPGLSTVSAVHLEEDSIDLRLQACRLRLQACHLRLQACRLRLQACHLRLQACRLSL
jgi:hypothetical protein